MLEHMILLEYSHVIAPPPGIQVGVLSMLSITPRNQTAALFRSAVIAFRFRHCVPAQEGTYLHRYLY